MKHSLPIIAFTVLSLPAAIGWVKEAQERAAYEELFEKDAQLAPKYGMSSKEFKEAFDDGNAPAPEDLQDAIEDALESN